ncbi:TMEM175 family protein [Nonomuraea sp. NPDC052129]|uniref:TMEM175 family protein n=1 Tax=Nonomuraea sp. NPDC052129 TaxID=3154651 RepID=UPI00342AFF07
MDSEKTPERLATTTAVPAHDTGDEDRRHVRDRVIFFSDAVIAIALTLLALELPVPEGRTESEIWHSFLDLLSPDYLIFVISFVVAARLWYSHQQLFRYVHRVDARLTVLNLSWLLMIVLLPFATRVLGATDLRFGTILYSVLIAGISFVLALMVHHCARHGLFDQERATPRWVRSFTLGTIAATAVFLLSIPVAFVDVTAAKFFWLLLFVAARVIKPLIMRGLPNGPSTPLP